MKSAAAVVMQLGESLIGRRIWTERYGEWPGGSAVVLGLYPDREAAPEIVMQVRSLAICDPEDDERLWEIGVLEHERIELL